MIKIIDHTDKTLGEFLLGEMAPTPKDEPEPLNHPALIFTRASEKSRPNGIDLLYVAPCGTLNLICEFDNMCESQKSTARILQSMNYFEDPAWDFLRNLAAENSGDQPAPVSMENFNLRQQAQRLTLRLNEAESNLQEIKEKYHKAISRTPITPENETHK